MSSVVTYAVHDGVATITMDDGRANALSLAMLRGLNTALDQAATDNAVTVLTGRESVFCGGYDLKELKDRSIAHELVDEGIAVALRLIEHPTPLVIACNGHAIAMGAIFLLCADYRIGVDGPFKVTTNEVAIGMSMSWAALEICRQRLNTTHFHRAVILAEPFTPAESVTAGFLDEVVRPSDLFDGSSGRGASLSRLGNDVYRNSKSRAQEGALRAIRAGHARDRGIA